MSSRFVFKTRLGAILPSIRSSVLTCGSCHGPEGVPQPSDQSYAELLRFLRPFYHIGYKASLIPGMFLASITVCSFGFGRLPASCTSSRYRFAQTRECCLNLTQAYRNFLSSSGVFAMGPEKSPTGSKRGSEGVIPGLLNSHSSVRACRINHQVYRSILLPNWYSGRSPESYSPVNKTH